MTVLETEPAPRKRDPEARRRAILEAATAIIVEEGDSALTHRAVAKRAGVALGSTTQYFSSIDDLRASALQLLSDEIDEELAIMEQEITHFITAPERAAAKLHEFLLDTRQVHAEVALIAAGTQNAELRALALRWTDRFIDALAPHVGRERATAIAVFADGALIHAALHDAPLPLASFTSFFRTILNAPDQDPS